ncbi:MAG: hypothetical protein QOH32_1992 [Bradyrhizobium sp.]|jgi:hypothetical protein|nr:hypothetical protein [Bradyrhizobium sp.]
MSQTLTWFDPVVAGTVRPACPNCRGSMMFTGIASGPASFDLPSFECLVCDDAEETFPVKTNMMGWINSRELRPPN